MTTPTQPQEMRSMHFVTRPTGSRDTGGIVLGAAAVTTGLVAGLYFAYSVSVMPALRHADDRTFVEVMQQINKSIQNPVFFAAFFGALVLPSVAAARQRRENSRAAATWTWIGFALYAVGFLITLGANVPLNDQLAKAGDHIADFAVVRHDFETPWTIWNALRTVVSTAALGCLSRALLLHRRYR